MPRSLHQPTRTCVGCRRTDRQQALVRLGRTEGGIALDARRRLPGRGAWLHRDATCWRDARGGVARALRTAVTERDLAAARAALGAAVATQRTNDPARNLLGATASDSGLLRRDAVDIATRGKAEE